MKRIVAAVVLMVIVASCKKNQNNQNLSCNCSKVTAKITSMQCFTTPCPYFMLELENGQMTIPRNLAEFDFTPQVGDSIEVCLSIDSLTMPPVPSSHIDCIEGVAKFYSPVCGDTPPVGELCAAQFERWFYNRNTQKCTKISYSGCSKKGFETEAECDSCKQCR